MTFLLFVHNFWWEIFIYRNKKTNIGLIGAAFFVAAILLAKFDSFNMCLVSVFIIVLFSIFTSARWCKSSVKYIDVDIVNGKYSHVVILLIALIVVMVRSYMGFVIPINWKSEFYHSILLFTFLGIGKALGGLFLGAVPVFFIKFETFTSMMIIVLLSLVSYILLNISLKNR